MTHVVTENCINCKHTECVEVCPVDCFRQTPLMLVIDPSECIDCAVCIPECPVNAIMSEDDVPAEQSWIIDLNRYRSYGSASITRRRSPLPDANVWKNVSGKGLLFEASLRSVNQADVEGKVEAYKDLVRAKELTSNEVEQARMSQDPIVRLLVAMRDDFQMDPNRLRHGIADPIDAVRRLYIQKYHADLGRTQIDQLIRDPSQKVREDLVRLKVAALTAAQRELALTDPAEQVRMSVIEDPDFIPTERQFFRSVEHGSWSETRAMLSKLNKDLAVKAMRHSSMRCRIAGYSLHSISLTRQQIKSGLSDPELDVRLAVVKRSDFVPTPKQLIDAVKSGKSELIRAMCQVADADCFEALIKLPDPSIVEYLISMMPNLGKDMLSRCVFDDRDQVVLAALHNDSLKLSSKQLTRCLRSSDERVRHDALKKFGVYRLSAKVLDSCVRDPAERVRSLIVSDYAAKLSPAQLALAFEDRSLSVRVAVAGRPDFLPTPQQLKRALADRSDRVRKAFSLRFKVTKGEVVDLNRQREDASQAELTAQLGSLLKGITDMPTWTAEKHVLRGQLDKLVSRLGYVEFAMDARRAWFSRTGEQKIIDVPLNQRGHLQPLKGRKVHLICLGSTTYSRVLVAAKAI
jgi:ferredoxin